MTLHFLQGVAATIFYRLAPEGLDHVNFHHCCFRWSSVVSIPLRFTIGACLRRIFERTGSQRSAGNGEGDSYLEGFTGDIK